MYGDAFTLPVKQQLSRELVKCFSQSFCYYTARVTTAIVSPDFLINITMQINTFFLNDLGEYICIFSILFLFLF